VPGAEVKTLVPQSVRTLTLGGQVVSHVDDDRAVTVDWLDLQPDGRQSVKIDLLMITKKVRAEQVVSHAAKTNVPSI